jgi:hypothetical protein
MIDKRRTAARCVETRAGRRRRRTPKTARHRVPDLHRRPSLTGRGSGSGFTTIWISTSSIHAAGHSGPRLPGRRGARDDFAEVWNCLRADAPLPGPPAAADFGTIADQLAGYEVGAAPDPSPTPSIDTESRDGNENIRSNLPAVADYGGSADD